MVDQEEIHNYCLSNNKEERKHALDQIKNSFSSMPDKQQAWSDLLRLTKDKNSFVRSKAAEALGSSFSHMPEKQQAWNDLLRLAKDKDSSVKFKAAGALISAFSGIPDKQQAWNDLLKLAKDKDTIVRSKAVEALISAFSSIPDKQQAWNDLLRLAKDKDTIVRSKAVEALCYAFSYMPVKQHAWNDLHRLVKYKGSSVNSRAAEALGLAFSDIQDKQQAWDYLLKLVNDQSSSVRSKAVYALGSSFSYMADKQQAWNDLFRLTNHEDKSVKYNSASALVSLFSQVPDKCQAWNDLHRLTNDENGYVRSRAAEALGFAFSQVPDKYQAWNDLHRLINDENSYVRYSVASALGSSFSHILDKEQAWNDLHRLTIDEDSSVKSRAAEALGSAFSSIPDKQQAWSDLHELTNDENSYVRYSAAAALSSAFSHMPDKELALNDLYRLTNDDYNYVRTSSNHSLGRVSIFNASQAGTDEEYKKELEKAIEYFEIAAKESSNRFDNQSKFCLPFYRSFYTIIFKKQEAKEEVNKYLEEAKAAIEGSESKKQLFETVENLSEALKEVQNLESLDLSVLKDELNFYRKYCEHAAELLKDTDEKAPFATEVMRKGLPILNKNLKKLLEEIQEKAKAICKKTVGTSAAPLGLETNKAAKELSEFFDYSALVDYTLNENIDSFKNYCGYILSGKKTQFLKMIEETKKMVFLKKLEGIKDLNEYILRNALFPRIENIFISNEVKENVRVATVQLDYALSENFPYQIKDEDKELIKQKIRVAFEKAMDEKVDLLCLPELCVCEEWLPEMRMMCQKMIVIAGTYYDKENHNVSSLLADFDYEIPPQLKIVPSDFEDSEITEQRMIPGEKVLNVYESQFGKFSVLICRDFGNFVSNLKGIVDVIFCPSYNEANYRFHNPAHNHVTDTPSYIVISNTAQYGGTSIFGRMRNSFFGSLIQNNCKDKADTSYKLCEIKAGEEGIIVADFNLIYKSPPMQTPMDPKDDIRPVKNIKKILF